MQLFTASIASSSAPPHLRVSRPPHPFPHLHRRRAPHLPPIAPKHPLLLASRRSILFTPRAHGNHCHHCGHGHHGHGHGHDGVEVHEGGGGAVVMRVARAIGWADVADALREHMRVCCISLGLLLMAAICPHVALLSSVERLPAALIAVAFPLVGVSAALDALVDIADGKINIHVLMALAAFASIFMGNSLEGGLLLAMFNLAHIAEEYFTSKSMYDVRELKENHPEFALLLETRGDDSVHFSNLSYTKVPVHDLEVDSHILVRAGEAVPVDGEVYQGSSTITIEHLTGETKPVERTVGDAIPGGARNLEGMMIVKVTKSWEDSTLNRIVQLTEEGQLNKPKLQRWLDEFGEHYSKVVVALSLAVALLGPFLFKWPFFGNSVCRGSIYRGLGLMVAASPCALAVAPLAYATAISSLASKGILLKGGHVLDALSSCQSIAFDKTGTLTTGKLMCKAIEPIHGHLDVSHGVNDPSCCTPNCESEALAVAAAMEKGTTHPIGRAVLNHSVGRDLPVVAVESFESLPGRGVVATLSGIKAKNSENELAKASIGSVEYISSLYRSNGESEQIKQAVKCSAFGPEFVQAALSVDKKVTLFHFEDEPRSGVCEVIYTLREKAKLRIMMLTGDHKSSAMRVAKAVCIDEVHFSLKPEDKLNKVKAVSREGGGGLIMVGDGINDAPALAAATVGIVLAQRASATAVAVADILLLQDNLCVVPFCIAKARQTTSLVKQSVALALTCIVFAALPSVLGFLPLWLTVLLHEGGTLLVCLNSIRALNHPTWSLGDDIRQLVDGLKNYILAKLNSSSKFPANTVPL
ncbi:probable cadmium/zinc-transporting ATPase HMA1, chloroplastic isoform X2 [Lolium perenne]|uniref:probable cadmium/zinc-transporting ATPase HMA1, chloroplastic isoform X2 n=1 Tax=Lolium perenne TaxID=4522 RepID=UPI0021F5B691|nr:probable cadmium/zinc-transporting ATPase HMA1, chloroplastic isoform X2 [Lolium perenne]